MNKTFNYTLKSMISVFSLAMFFFGTCSILVPTDSFGRNVHGGGNRNANVNRNTNVKANRNVNANRNTNVNANRNVNVNRNTNVNVNRNVNVNHRGGHYGGGYYGHDHDYHPVATAAAVTATAVVTAAVVGSMVRTIPPSCSAVQYNNMTYQQCGNTWYQPQYSGSSVQYIVINPPY